MAATQEYDGVENIPEEFRVQIDERMQVFLEQQLPAATSPARIEETIDFVQKTDIADARVGKTPILKALEIARAQAESRLAFKNKQALGEIPEEMSFNEYLQNNAEALAEMNANIRKTEREKERQFFIDAAPTNKTLMRGPY
jgi:chromosome condensin MukBEF complex kleisin-like MukF subunit